jgi:predicted O-methyltransferase YrrM
MILDRTGLREAYPFSWRWLRIARRIGGWLTDAEGNALFELARRRTPQSDAMVVELGAWQGKSSVLLAAGLLGKNAPRLFCIDPFGEDENPQYQTAFYSPMAARMRHTLEEMFRRNIRRCGLASIVQPIKSHSCQAVLDWRQPIDILFIDASHDYESVHRDLLLWSPFLKVGGVVALRDVSATWPGPSRVMAEDLQPPYFGDLEQADSLLWAVKKTDHPLPVQPQPAVTTIPKSDFDARQREIARLSAERKYLIEELARHSGIPNQLRGVEYSLENAEAVLKRKLKLSTEAFAEAQHTVASLRASWSWKITAPLRLAADVVALLGSNPAHSGRVARPLKQWVRFRRLVWESGVFDERYYLKRYPDVAENKISPLYHFFLFGGPELRQPHLLFDTGYYLARNPEVAATGVNPLVHYLKWGAYEGRNPHPAFDSAYYLQQNPDVREMGLNPLAHYLGPGTPEGRNPNNWFDTSAYLDRNPEVAISGLNPLAHYLAMRENSR